MWKNKSKNYKKIDYTMNYEKSNIRKMNTHAFYIFISLSLFSFLSISLFFFIPQNHGAIVPKPSSKYISRSPTGGALTNRPAGWRAACGSSRVRGRVA
jgi:hypothetical protein